MSIKKNIDKLRQELEKSIADLHLHELFKEEIISISQRLDKEIARFYSEGASNE
jgi:hypothetical protein